MLLNQLNIIILKYSYYIIDILIYIKNDVNAYYCGGNAHLCKCHNDARFGHDCSCIDTSSTKQDNKVPMCNRH